MTAIRSSGATRGGLILFISGTVAIGVAYLAAIVQHSAPAWAPWPLAYGSVATSVGLFVIGSATRGPVPRTIAGLLAALFLVLVVSFGAALAMAPNEGPGGPLMLGLPVRLAIVFYGVGFVPLFVLPLAFGLSYEERHDA